MAAPPTPPPYWSTIHRPLQEMITTIINRIETDKRDELESRAVGLRMYLVGTIRVVRSIYDVVEVITIDRKRAEVPLECAIAVPPLARVILDAVFSTTYLLEDPGTRLPQFWKNVWAKIALQYDRDAAEHGTDPRWVDALAQLARNRDAWRDDARALGGPLTAAELADPDLYSLRWPNPGKMPRKCQQPTRKDVLEYLDARYYAELSGAAHLSGMSMLGVVAHVLHDPDVEGQRAYATRQFGIAATMLLCLLSVYALDVIREAGFARRVVVLWDLFINESGPRDIYEHCYKESLAVLTGAGCCERVNATRPR